MDNRYRREGKNLARVKFSPDLFQAMITTGWMVGLGGDTEAVICTKGIPPGAVFRGAHYDLESGLLEMLFEHPLFDEVPSGGVIPAIPIHYTEKYRPLHTDSGIIPEAALQGQKTDGD